ncbi:MAG: DMT family transporter [Candidatus Rhabdochlamydia sp.]
MQKNRPSTEIASSSQHLKYGIGYILIACFFITAMATLSRFASNHVSLPVIIFFQNFISLITVLPWIFKHGWSSLRTEHMGLIIVRSLAGLLSFSFLFLAVRRISLVNAVLLNNAAPLLLPFVAWIWLKLPINHKLWPGILCGFLGVLFILKPGTEIINPGALYGLAAAVTLSVAMLTLRRLSHTDRNHTVLFYYFLFSSLICLPLSIYWWTTPNFLEWLQIIFIGIFSAAGQWSLVRAFHHANPTVLGPFCYVAVIYSGIFEWVLYGIIPDWIGLVGVFLVCLGGIWTIRFNRLPRKIL